MNCMVCNKLLEAPHQRICPACMEEFREAVVKQLGGEEQYKRLLCWPKHDMKGTKK